MKCIFCCSSRKCFLALGLLLIASALGVATWDGSERGHRVAQPPTQPDATTKARLSAAYGQLPLSFEANNGQFDPRVDFISRGSGYTLFLTPREAVLALRAAPAGDDHQPAVLRMKFPGSETRPRVKGQEELPGKINYFIGNDPQQWRTGISTYAKVAYQNVYPGIDLVYYGNQRQLEYDFVVQPGTDPNIIAINFEGADQLKIDAQGELVLHARGSEVRQRKPFIYQEVDGVRQEVAGSYKLKDTNTVGFHLAEYDTSRRLVIDPVLVYSTFLGTSAEDVGFDIDIDAAGNTYVTGHTQQLTLPSGFPTTPGAFDTTHNGDQDVFVTKLNPSGSALVYSTFLGAGNIDLARGIAVDASGNAYIAGLTTSVNFPTTPGALDTTHNGGFFDAFVTKLNPSGSALVYSTFLGADGSDVSNDIAIDASGNAFVVGTTNLSTFPTTAGAFDTTFNGDGDNFLTKLNPAGSAIVYSTFLGSSGPESEAHVTVDTSGSAYVVGTTFGADFPTTAGAFDTTHDGPFIPFVRPDAFVAKFNPAGSALVYSTFLGGNSHDFGRDIDVDTSGSAFVTGLTASTNFPTTAGAFDTTFNGINFSDVFVTKLHPSGSTLVYSTFLGGSDSDEGHGIKVDTSGIAYVTGISGSPNFPTTPDAFATTRNGPFSSDAILTKVNSAGSALVYSTYFGGMVGEQANSIAIDTSGNAYMTGFTRSSDFPTTAGAFDTTYNGLLDAFVVKFSTTGVPATIALNPPADTNPVDSQHCVTATVQDASGNPIANVVVRFQVSGSSDTSGSATTGANGQATFCYIGPPLPGADTITAYADSDNNNVQDSGEPIGVAEKTWVVPASTPLCEVTNGGWIIAANGDRASFGGNAKANGEAQGHQSYQDHGPAQRLNLHSIIVQAVVCDGSTRASIFGQAAINGSGPFNFRINVRDLGQPGKGQDTYWLLTDSYNSGEQRLGGGNIQIRRR